MNITVICGKLCSGKTTLAKAIQYGLNCNDQASVDRFGPELKNDRIIGSLATKPKKRIHCVMIEVSSIVKAIVQANDRETLQNTANLDNQIFDKIVQLIEVGDSESWPTDVIISGLRQLSIYFKIQNRYQVTGIWVETADNIRKSRFESRKDQKDDKLSFEAYDSRDLDLGLGLLKDYIVDSTL
jgi:cytidylate kinase